MKRTIGQKTADCLWRDLTYTYPGWEAYLADATKVGLECDHGAMEVRCVRYGLEVTYLRVNEEAQGLGFGSSLMQEFCNWADRNRVRMRLWAKPFASCPDRSPYSLVPFYAKHGFHPVFVHRVNGAIDCIRMHRG